MRLPIREACLVRPRHGDPSPMMLVVDGGGTRHAISAHLAGIEYPDETSDPRRVYRAVVQDDDATHAQQILVFWPVEIASSDYWAENPRAVRPASGMLVGRDVTEETSDDAT